MQLLFKAINITFYLAIHICHDIFTCLGIIRQLLPKSQGKITYYLRLMEKYSKMFLCQHISFLSLVQIMVSAGELYSIFILKYYFIIYEISKYVKISHASLQLNKTPDNFRPEARKRDIWEANAITYSSNSQRHSSWKRKWPFPFVGCWSLRLCFFSSERLVIINH